MRVTKKLIRDLEVVDSLQRITGYKNNKYSREKSPRTILLQKISSNDNNIPIKVQLLKTKNHININNYSSNLFNTNSNSVSINKRKIPFPKKEINNYNKYNKCEAYFKETNLSKNSIKKLKDSLIMNNQNNRRLISESPIENIKYRNITYKNLTQSPTKKNTNHLSNNININTNDNHNEKEQNKKEHKIRNVLSYNKKKPNSAVTSPQVKTEDSFQKIIYKQSRKNSSDSNNNSINNNPKTHAGRDNYSVGSFKNKNANSPPKTPSYLTDIDSYNLKINNTNINNNNITNNNNNIFNNNYFIVLKLDDLIILEERLNDINIALNPDNFLANHNEADNNKYDIGALNECYEFFSFYFHSSLKYKFPLFFHEPNRIIIQSAINLKLFVIMITYHLSMNHSMITKILDDLKLIYSLLKQNYYLFIKKLNIFYGEAFILQNEMYFKNFNYILSRNGLYDLNENEIKDIINQNCCNIVKNITIILNYYQFIGNNFYLDFFEIFNVLSKITEKEINNYFCTYLYGLKKPKNPYVINQNKRNNNLMYNIKNINININNTNNINDKKLLKYQINQIPVPYITTPTTKKYTLVLDLDNTLISHNIKNPNDMCNLRPGLLSFLNTLKPIYELISFTNESKEYSEQLLKEIESSRKYFDYNFCIEHNVLIDNNFIKDISKIGRDMKKIIIVDKNYENIKSTPQNGILIKPYFGESSKNDTVLFELKKLLVLFHKMGYEDLRVAIKNSQNDIKYKITLDKK